ncbi:5-(carboxyamino)imidazole ribonucleotide synthase [Pseudolysinimonas yzui]|uniref:N5-carboxyaminoimidazole ribonucleotide synthase n=1 Tax=Pseudolysinimonas yzui TaxID=2708254 RepID=A0A8J3M477_9MICO|nr:5-(carboxyamino)imidazole ribonucleotide synthase [Pseudolysinimonas yzui]GHF15321.1 N5-carboxyaminoimidazole ribonucleotide synthase [Pseudolysinimonas yzui]
MRVGVIGGGQLARMMVPPAVALGIDIRVLAESADSSARIAATAVGDYRDAATVLDFATGIDVVTFDHEHVPQDVLARLEASGVAVRPGRDPLEAAQDKIRMRERLAALGVPIPDWAAVRSESDLAEFLAAHRGVAIVKTPRGGYDGKGVRVVRSAGDAADWLAEGDVLAEELVDFRRELAQLIARRPSGETAAWPLVETIQREGVCAEVLAPAPDAGDAAVEARAIAEAIAEGLGVTGVLAVELFQATDGRLLVNELAMRPHNSGHWTIEGAVTSQFEQHLRAVLDLPLGDPTPLAPVSVMVNVLGGPVAATMPDRYPEAFAAHPDVKFHSYGKASRPGRKVGHVTATGADLAEVRARARAAAGFFEA